VDETGVGKRIREERRKRGWNQTQLAEAAGLSLDTVSTLERGEHKPRPSSLRKLAKALGLSISELVGEPAIAGKAEAPPAGRDRGETAFEVAYEAARRQHKEDRQAVNRLLESGTPQHSFVRHENEAERLLREEYSVVELAEDCVKLARHLVWCEENYERLVKQLESIMVEAEGKHSN